MALQAGQAILHYRVLEKIEQGGMGEVYKAEDRKLGRQVALKLLPPDAAQHEKAKLCLLQKARAASALNHPNIVRDWIARLRSKYSLQIFLQIQN